jgi:diguanylate cyclase (GGDEF)-like protein
VLTIVRHLQPREPEAAARAVGVLAATCLAAGALALLVLPPPSFRGVALAVMVAAHVLIGLVAVPASHLLRRAPAWLWAVLPIAATAVLSLACVTLYPSTPVTLLFFFCPVLFSAVQLPRPGVRLVIILSILAAGAVTLSESRTGAGVLNFLFVSTALAMSSWLLAAAETRRAQLVEQLRRQAAVDPLTGLVTRRVLDDAARSALSGSASHQGTVLMVLDVDHFKQINDRYGHPGGDEVLQQLARLLTARARPEDVVCRMGGDEVALLLPGCPLEVGLQRAREVIEDVRTRAFSAGPTTDLRVTVSVGVAHAPTDAEDLRALYSAADAVLYRAKRAGRDRTGTRSSLAAAEQ